MKVGKNSVWPTTSMLLSYAAPMKTMTLFIKFGQIGPAEVKGDDSIAMEGVRMAYTPNSPQAWDS